MYTKIHRIFLSIFVCFVSRYSKGRFMIGIIPSAYCGFFSRVKRWVLTECTSTLLCTRWWRLPVTSSPASLRYAQHTNLFDVCKSRVLLEISILRYRVFFVVQNTNSAKYAFLVCWFFLNISPACKLIVCSSIIYSLNCLSELMSKQVNNSILC